MIEQAMKAVEEAEARASEKVQAAKSEAEKIRKNAEEKAEQMKKDAEAAAKTNEADKLKEVLNPAEIDNMKAELLNKKTVSFLLENAVD